MAKYRPPSPRRLSKTTTYRPFPMVGDPPGLEKMTKKEKERALYEQAIK